jgi:hypothetical protein
MSNIRAANPFADVPGRHGPIQQPTQAGIERTALTKQRGKLA